MFHTNHRKYGSSKQLILQGISRKIFFHDCFHDFINSAPFFLAETKVLSPAFTFTMIHTVKDVLTSNMYFFAKNHVIYCFENFTTIV